MKRNMAGPCSVGVRRRGLGRAWSAIVAVACGFVLMTMSGASAQLGPKDGANLPATDLDRVKVGAVAPDFTLESMDGQRITLSDVHRNKKVILVFYRGQW